MTTTTLKSCLSRVDMWRELPRLAEVAHAHIGRHPGLVVASVEVFTTDLGPGRVVVHVPGDLALACTRLLAWRDTLTRASSCLEIEADPQQPKAMIFGRLYEGTPATVVAPLAEEHVVGVERSEVGDRAMVWLRARAERVVSAARE
ncbi:hypothetical protein JOD54_006475 [Actinokineospora baliensis]|uniref:hypothetical protein n=1 Tax=Actinokineospora baliensis TaxID=547056 RepID=UPI00195A05DC|nr:hypothetical protein [Actinokineospora baliensis]MBM7776271.1 hypothetical protein [Actinokineospora baliensis]